jgi:hypothetical protein
MRVSGAIFSRMILAMTQAVKSVHRPRADFRRFHWRGSWRDTNSLIFLNVLRWGTSFALMAKKREEVLYEKTHIFIRRHPVPLYAWGDRFGGGSGLAAQG